MYQGEVQPLLLDNSTVHRSGGSSRPTETMFFFYVLFSFPDTQLIMTKSS
jgi:hypothetical protein